MECVTLGTEAEAPLPRSLGRADDRHVRELHLDRLEVVSARPRTALAADRLIMGLGSGAAQYSLWIGRMAEKTLEYAVGGIEGLSQEILSPLGVGRMPGRAHPARVVRSVVIV